MAEKKLLPFPDAWKNNPGHPVETDKKLPLLFTPLKIRSIELKNRIMVSPMCQYSSHDGLLNDWHLVHLGGFARGGAGLICIEATGVMPNGRISPFDSGIWDDKHIMPIKRIVDFAHEHKAHVAIQLAHAGRKASTIPPFAPHGSPPGVPDEQGGWTPVAPSAIPFHESYRHPVALSKDQIKDLVKAFADAAIRADKAGDKKLLNNYLTNTMKLGIDVVEIHGAHGYLIHSFLSPLSNVRTDEYGGSFEGRTRFLLEVTKAVREVWPQEKPLFVRLSCTDWVEGGWTPEETVRVSKLLKELGVDALDCSSGGGTMSAKIPVAPGYQVPFSETVRKETDVLTCAVGMLTDPHQVETILQKGQADIIAIAREFLRNTSWTLDAARELGVDVEWASQYNRAKF